jgi:uncharacterized protein with NAD-binding domain and iron-sulfur cluster
MGKRVLVLGGGLGGLSAAQELVERGFEVEVLEANAVPGGKARSVKVPESGTGGRDDLPGEHGFRFFPGFYQHLPDTMRRIPYRLQPGGCADNLVPTHQLQIARFGRSPITAPSRFPTSLDAVQVALHALFGNELGLADGEMAFFGERLWRVMTSCRARRLAELELLSWWEFVDAAHRSEAYRKFLATGLSRSLVSARPEEASARTIGQVQVHLLEHIVTPGAVSDRVLNGPTNEVLVDPWVAYLAQRGVTFRMDAVISGIRVVDGEVRGVTIGDRHRRSAGWTATADYYVAALPVEDMARLITPELEAADPRLAAVRMLSSHVRWMNGIQFFLREDVPVIRGHVLYLDSPWAITSISQPQFWQRLDLAQRGDGTVRGIISVDISDWDTPGHFVPLPARRCESRDQIAHEVWEELKLSLNVEGKVLLRDDMRHSWFMDPNIIIPDPERPRDDVNLQPLFINTPDSWRLRPTAAGAIPNLFLASDYVQCETDLASMEAANEAARRAVNALLEADGSTAEPCRLFDMDMPAVLAPWRARDQRRFDRGLPWDGKPF